MFIGIMFIVICFFTFVFIFIWVLVFMFCCTFMLMFRCTFMHMLLTFRSTLLACRSWDAYADDVCATFFVVRA